MTAPVLFGNDEFELQLIRRDGDTFEVAAPNVARYLGFRAASDLLRVLPEDEKGYELVRTPGGDQRVSTLTEPGLYRVLGQRQAARIPDKAVREMVERFQRWLFHEVLPAFRRGEIAVADRAPAVPQNYADALRAAADQFERAEVAEAKVIEQGQVIDKARPKVAYVDTFVRAADDACTIGDLAKQLGVREKALREHLQAQRLIYRRPIGTRLNRRGAETTDYKWLPYADERYEHWFVVLDQADAPRGHNGQLRTTLYVTPVGKVGIRELLACEPIGEIDARQPRLALEPPDGDPLPCIGYSIQ